MFWSFFQRVFTALWGELSEEEYKKFAILGFTFFLIIGAYWLLRPLKDSIFATLVGIEWQPLAKIVSLGVLAPLLVFYSKLVDLFERHNLFYLITIFYGFLFLMVTILLTMSAFGLNDVVASPYHFLGWFIYILIESFGSIVVALFWSFVASITKVEAAKKGYPLVLAGGQMGSILGPTLGRFAPVLGSIKLMMVANLVIFLIPLLVWIFMHFVSEKVRRPVSSAVKVKPTGPFEGLRLLFSHSYLLGVFGIATLYEVVGTILDYQMKVLAFKVYIHPDERTAFLSLFGQSANILALIFALVGTSYFLRKYGLTFCLVLFPTAVGFMVGYVYYYPVLWSVFFAMIIIKGLSYALNNPAKEVMYIPTSRDVKFKAKGWIDAFGGRTAKAGGSAITNFFKASPAELMFYGTLISLGIVGIWLVISFWVGKTFEKYQRQGYIVK